MGKKIIKITASLIGCLILAFLLGVGIAEISLPNQMTLVREDALPSYPCVALSGKQTVSENEAFSVSTVSAKLFGVIQLKKIEVKEYHNLSLIPGGQTFGVKVLTDGVLIVGISEVSSGGVKKNPAAEAGIQVKDVLLSVNGVKVHSAVEVAKLLEEATDKAVLVCRRGDKEMTFTVTLVKSDEDGKNKAGLWVKDTTSGIGTVTYIVPKTGEFGALGHGICDSETGALVPLSRGTVTGVKIHSIHKGTAGTPGELRGYLCGAKKGAVIGNTDCGVFGVFSECPDSTPIPVATPEEVKEGKAVLRCSLDGEEVKEYEIEIKDIRSQSKTKSFVVHITDKALLEKTGGIVQGMSGSPIIQNGKLVGAVTHVMINDPTTGYGIFIENMLNASQNQAQPKAA
ncbi:MAG: SpoIVB peptidase [Clostridia bacterium]|nr:SpoIVB peptidase [Clostridia bacterium]